MTDAERTPQRRITVEEVLEAYRVTGILPGVGTYCTHAADVACAIGAVAISVGADRVATKIYKWACGEFGEDYLEGFTSAFDGDALREPKSTERESHGLYDGTAVREAVFGKQGA